MTALRPDDILVDAKDRPLKRGHEEVASPTTPRPPAAQSMSAGSNADAIATDPRPSSPMQTDVTPMPTTALATPAAYGPAKGSLHPRSSQSSGPAPASAEAMDVGLSDEDRDGSDNDTENGEPGRSSKKKKGQRFFCTDFPPCNLSFTRSEHLARHIR